jgi:hypothetical protein
MLRARGFGRERPELVRRILRWLAYRPGSPAHQRHLVRFLRRGSGSPGSLRLVNVLRNTPSILRALQENVRSIQAVLDCIKAITIPSPAASSIIHIYLRSATLKALDPTTPSPREPPSFDIAGVERVLQHIL